jgi:hypothetical protein
MTHRKPKVGDVLQLSLPDGQFAYGRMLRDGSVAFYREMSQRPASPPIGSRDYQFVVGVNSGEVTRDDVPIVGHDRAASDDDDFAPNGSIQDPITGAMSIYDFRTWSITPSTPEATAGLEPVAAWSLDHVVDRLMGFGHLWTRSAYDVTQEIIARRSLEAPE